MQRIPTEMFCQRTSLAQHYDAPLGIVGFSEAEHTKFERKTNAKHFNKVVRKQLVEPLWQHLFFFSRC